MAVGRESPERPSPTKDLGGSTLSLEGQCSDSPHTPWTWKPGRQGPAGPQQSPGQLQLSWAAAGGQPGPAFPGKAASTERGLLH